MAGEGGPGPTEEPKVRAERLFAELTGQAERQGGDSQLVPGPPPDAPPVAPTAGLTHLHDGGPSKQEIREFLLGARDAIEHGARGIRLVRSQVKATRADLAAFGDAVEQALGATNDRLASLERHLLGEVGPGADAVEQAMARLRSTLRPSGEDADGGAGPTAAP